MQSILHFSCMSKHNFAFYHLIFSWTFLLFDWCRTALDRVSSFRWLLNSTILFHLSKVMWSFLVLGLTSSYICNFRYLVSLDDLFWLGPCQSSGNGLIWIALYSCVDLYCILSFNLRWRIVFAIWLIHFVVLSSASGWFFWITLNSKIFWEWK